MPQHRNRNHHGNQNRNGRQREQNDNQFNGDTMPSPYNFAPLPANIAFPDKAVDAEPVSHNKPFKEGLSGELKVTVKAETEIYIRNGGEHPKEPNERNVDPKYIDFFRLQPDDSKSPYAIPGSSIKGSIRNVLEIASYSAMECANQRYSVRDLSDRRNYTSWITTKEVPHEAKVQAGWLKKSARDNGYAIEPCNYCRVEQNQLDDLLNIKISAKVKKGKDRKGKDILKEPTAPDKYTKLKNKVLPTAVFFRSNPYTHEKTINGQCHNLLYERAEQLSFSESFNTPKKGEFVFTGQISRKHLEFIFYDPSGVEIPVSSEDMLNFEFIHSQERPGGENASAAKNEINSPNEEWKFWKRIVQDGGRAPVFYLAYTSDHVSPDTVGARLDEPSSKLFSFGLAMMFRMASQLDTHGARRNSAENDYDSFAQGQCDLAQTIFGYIDEKEASAPVFRKAYQRNKALRGRVNFEPFIAEGRPEELALQPKSAVLNSPKPPFALAYLEHKKDGKKDSGRHDRNEVASLMQTETKLRGFKRYPLHKQTKDSVGGTDAMTTKFRPLKAGTEFNGSIFFHNLRPFELGALIWALNFGKDPNDNSHSYRHSLGMAKPLGYGAVKIEIKNSDIRINQPNGNGPTLSESLKNFRDFMKKSTQDSKWEGSETIRELLAMSDFSREPHKPDYLRYPVLNDQRTNHFKDLKMQGFHLMRYGSMSGNKIDTTSIGEALQDPVDKKYKIGQEVEVEAFELRNIRKKKIKRWRVRIVGDDRTDGYLQKVSEELLGETLKKGWKGKALIEQVGKNNFSYKTPDS